MASFNKSDRNFEHFYRAIKYIFDSVGSNGSWGGDDFEEWKPIITALTLELFFDLQTDLDSVWYIKRDSRLSECPLAKTLSYLDECIKDDGQFGEDLWDSVRFSTIVVKNDIESRLPRFSKLKAYVENAIAASAFKKSSPTWDGPGIQSACVDYLDETGQRQRADSIYEHLLTLQLQDGSFRGPVNEVGESLSHPVWHTSQVLITSLRRKPCEKDEEIQKMVKYILDSRDLQTDHWRSFSRYDVYFTSYAILALIKLNNRPTNIIEKSVDWLCSQMSESGKVKDAGGTIMAALALRSLFPQNITAEIGLADLRYLDLAKSMITDLEVKLADEKENGTKILLDLNSYRSKFDKADIVLTKKEFLFMTIFGLGLSLVFGLIPFFITSFSNSGGKDDNRLVLDFMKMQLNSPQPSKDTSPDNKFQVTTSTTPASTTPAITPPVDPNRKTDEN